MLALRELAVREMSRARESAYLNHAASSPLPLRSAQALRGYVEDRERVFHLYQAGRPDYDTAGLRAKAGALLGVPPGSLGFVPTTTDGLSGFLNGIDWRPGDNLVVPADDFPGVVTAALNLARRGVEVRQVPVDGHLDLARVDAAVDRRTRAVAASHVHWITGHRIDLGDLVRICRRVEAYSVVDAIQSLGQLPVAPLAAGVDVLVAGSYKWLMGVPGTALFYASDRVLAESIPDRAGWRSMRDPRGVSFPLAWSADATRFHVGGLCDPALIALERSIELLLELGAETIATAIRTLQDRLLAGLPETLTALSPREPAHRSGILALTTGDPARDEALVERLKAARVIISFRLGRIRVAPHWHNTPGDVDRFLEAVREGSGKG